MRLPCLSLLLLVRRCVWHEDCRRHNETQEIRREWARAVATKTHLSPFGGFFGYAVSHTGARASKALRGLEIGGEVLDITYLPDQIDEFITEQCSLPFSLRLQLHYQQDHLIVRFILTLSMDSMEKRNLRSML